MREHEEAMVMAAGDNKAHVDHLREHWKRVRRNQRIAAGFGEFDFEDLFEEDDEEEGKKKYHAQENGEGQKGSSPVGLGS